MLPPSFYTSEELDAIRAQDSFHGWSSGGYYHKVMKPHVIDIGVKETLDTPSNTEDDYKSKEDWVKFHESPIFARTLS